LMRHLRQDPQTKIITAVTTKMDVFQQMIFHDFKVNYLILNKADH